MKQYESVCLVMVPEQDNRKIPPHVTIVQENNNVQTLT